MGALLILQYVAGQWTDLLAMLEVQAINSSIICYYLFKYQKGSKVRICLSVC